MAHSSLCGQQQPHRILHSLMLRRGKALLQPVKTIQVVVFMMQWLAESHQHVSSRLRM